MYSYGPPHVAVQKQDDQHEHTFSSYVRIRDVVLKTCLGRWTIGRSGERGSGISVLPARHDDDDDDSLHENMLLITALTALEQCEKLQTGIWVDMVKIFAYEKIWLIKRNLEKKNQSLLRALRPIILKWKLIICNRIAQKVRKTGWERWLTGNCERG